MTREELRRMIGRQLQEAIERDIDVLWKGMYIGFGDSIDVGSKWSKRRSNVVEADSWRVLPEQVELNEGSKKDTI